MLSQINGPLLIIILAALAFLYSIARMKHKEKMEAIKGVFKDRVNNAESDEKTSESE